MLVCVALFGSLASGVFARRQAPARVDAAAEAIRLNNLGVASMNQQKPEVALERFEAAAKADPSLAAARLNQAIAMTALQRYEPAQQILDALVKAEPGNVRAWYNLGLLARTLGESETALAAFTRATELAPGDAHAHYFAGLHRQPAAAARPGDRVVLARARARSVPGLGRVRHRARLPAQREGRRRQDGTWTGSRG